MSLGLVGRKVGMTRIFTEAGASIPVTVLDVSNNRVAQIKTQQNDGYSVVQLAFGKRRPSRVSKPLAGHLAKAGVEAGHVLKEFPVSAEELAELKAGDQVSITIFAVGQKVDVTGQDDRQGLSPVRSSGITFRLRTRRTATPCRTRRWARRVWRRIRGVFFRARRWLVIWVLPSAPSKISKSFASTSIASCCCSRVRFPAPRGRT
jgi:hypothetical protein